MLLDQLYCSSNQLNLDRPLPRSLRRLHPRRNDLRQWQPHQSYRSLLLTQIWRRALKTCIGVMWNILRGSRTFWGARQIVLAHLLWHGRDERSTPDMFIILTSFWWSYTVFYPSSLCSCTHLLLFVTTVHSRDRCFGTMLLGNTKHGQEAKANC